MRRRAGLGAIQRQRDAQSKYSAKRAELEENQVEELSRQLETFRAHLQQFAGRHRSEIRRDARFRRQFQEMCAAIGVDPLASNKGFWSQMLGVGDFYYELAVRVVEACLAAAPRTGGLMPLEELRRRLQRAGQQEVSQDDLLRAISKLRVLGTGFQLLRLAGDRHLVQSVPGELSGDATAVLERAQAAGGRVTAAELGWSADRAQRAIQQLVRDELAWVDEQTGGDDEYWFPSLFPGLSESE
ncbi:vacuolar-sorting protein SNF8-like [Pollicipes pollicipes]|uniref:vacuolar-sorting protein SNF8-like n=1 Tax=Pollicipes pollicipes TaxID=41117 RepID=UPI0018856945|nr:vacuolar-sorting protein SNF8-like [Pollicipes pollicipes]